MTSFQFFLILSVLFAIRHDITGDTGTRRREIIFWAIAGLALVFEIIKEFA